MRSPELFFLFSEVTRIKGVGRQLAALLGRLLDSRAPGAGGEELIAPTPIVRDLLFHLPSAVIDRGFTCPLRTAPQGVVATFVVRVDSHQPSGAYGKGARRPYRVYCSNETGELTLVYFHARAPQMQQMFPIGEMRVISGRVEHFDYRTQMTHPDIVAPVAKKDEVMRTEAVYPLTQNLTSRRLAALIAMALEKTPDLPEWLLPETVQRHDWLGWKASLIAAHHPEAAEAISPNHPARERLAYDELLAHQLGLALVRTRMQQKPGHVIAPAGELRQNMLKNLPFPLTSGQVRVLAEIDADLASGKRMTRLVQGDVGSGKTLVALGALLHAVEAGFQTALMAPTELIARQHYEGLARLCESLGVRVALLTGSVKGSKRQQLLSALEQGEIDILIGTHALFQDHVTFQRLALAVIDEQHRFGVGQRHALISKGENTHLLHMTATPIPRSLTMTLYGDMDCSLMPEKPAGRQTIDTRVMPLMRYMEVIEGLKRAIVRGEKVYWICPLVEAESIETIEENSEAAAVSRHLEFQRIFAGRAGLAHGRMKADERSAAVEAFAKGEVDILVATTVVEVGVDVKDATIIVIEQAERFGLSQLHQLRGRVGRGSQPSVCLLLYSDNTGEQGLARLRILRETEDGFRIAEEDMRLRGGGEIFGTRQSGLPRFFFVDLYAHDRLIHEARTDAVQFVTNDPLLQTERGRALNTLLQLYGHAG